jgi:hypothetical protein
MKKILLTVIMAMSLIACKEKTEMPNETSSEEKTAVKDSVAENNSKITFEDFKTEYKETAQKAAIDFNSNPNGKGFKTAITDSYKLSEVNFSGYYIIATWGCGTACINGVMVDVRDGKIYDLPADENGEGIGNAYESDKSSSLLITSISGVPLGDDIEKEENYWKWNETNKKFEFIKTLDIKRK